MSFGTIVDKRFIQRRDNRFASCQPTHMGWSVPCLILWHLVPSSVRSHLCKLRYYWATPARTRSNFASSNLFPCHRFLFCASRIQNELLFPLGCIHNKPLQLSSRLFGRIHNKPLRVHTKGIFRFNIRDLSLPRCPRRRQNRSLGLINRLNLLVAPWYPIGTYLSVQLLIVVSSTKVSTKMCIM